MWRERGQQTVFVDKGVYIWQNEWGEKKPNYFTGINEWRVAAQSELVVVALPMFLVGQNIIQRDFLAGHNSSRTSQMHVVMAGANNNERLNSFFWRSSVIF